ncbi:MAG: acyl-CoA dehydrogenase [Chitinivibrionales bacterium]|nr:acyl-CoA dehydrogenase [Chitinivibrionales bacterium]
MLQATARDFAQQELKPAVAEVQRLKRANIPHQPWDVCKDAVKKGAELGFNKLLIPEQYGGLGRDCIDHVIIQEELATAGGGITGYFAATFPMMIVIGGTEEQKNRWLPEICSSEVFILASAGNEPDVAGSDFLCPYPDPKIGIKTFARREGDEYIINGCKAAFCTHAGVADAYFVMARTDLSRPMRESSSTFYVPADTPGLSFGKNTEMLGQCTMHHSEVYLDDVRVPETNRIGGEGELSSLFVIKCLPYFGTGLAAIYTGLARAAYDYASAYAHERKSWGQPIVRHQAVTLKLADMLVNIEAARLMTWDAACAIDSGSHLANMKSTAAKTLAVDTAIQCAENAVKILGGYGVAEEYETVRMLQDAWMGYSCDGTRDTLRLGMMAFLEMAQGSG